MSTEHRTTSIHPEDPREWTSEDVARFWLENRHKRVVDRVSGREGEFVDVINCLAYVRRDDGREFETRCGDLRVVSPTRSRPAT
ncbi:hypothetical protein ACFRCG_15130 [Embleya sp. NPDC056575]|uniref:hypothetical protein n=1 Tax=unclassified Embleya TaxID=2699296 RepID=UPI00369EDB42